MWGYGRPGVFLRMQARGERKGVSVAWKRDQRRGGRRNGAEKGAGGGTHVMHHGRIYGRAGGGVSGLLASFLLCCFVLCCVSDRTLQDNASSLSTKVGGVFQPITIGNIRLCCPHRCLSLQYVYIQVATRLTQSRRPGPPAAPSPPPLPLSAFRPYRLPTPGMCDILFTCPSRRLGFLQTFASSPEGRGRAS